jgi:hypothetical protein
MRLKSYPGLILALLFACGASHALAQADPAATETKLPLAIGVGFSDYNPDLGHGHLLGGTLWADYTPNHVPAILRGIGLEAEARDLRYGRSKPKDLRRDVVGGGVIYSWPHYRDFRPYAKYEMGFGRYQNSPTDHDTRTVTIMGGGAEYRVLRSVWARVDYEYQFWPDCFGPRRPGLTRGKLTPEGITVGAAYHFSQPRFR